MIHPFVLIAESILLGKTSSHVSKFVYIKYLYSDMYRNRGGLTETIQNKTVETYVSLIAC